MNKRHYEHTLPNIRGSLSNTYSGNVTLTQEESNMKLTLTVRQKGKTSIDIEQ